MNSTLTTLIQRLDEPSIGRTNVIPWSSPVPSFGDLPRARIATLGINPSNREFVDVSGDELDGASRRFPTLRSLGLKRWSDANGEHLESIVESCQAYFSRNPYDTWFTKLDRIISGTATSYYNGSACHLDLIPYATACKWTDLTHHQRSALFHIAGDTLARVLKESPIEILILNGSSVVREFERCANVTLEKIIMQQWSLSRKAGSDVCGFAFRGAIRNISGMQLTRKVRVFGFNHNIQSSFGVTRRVIEAICGWIRQVV